MGSGPTEDCGRIEKVESAMKPLIVGRRIKIQIKSCDDDPTITEIMSDPIVAAVMKADRVDPVALEAQLRSLAQEVTVAQP